MTLASARAAALVVALSALGTLGILGTVSCATPLLKLPTLPEGPGGRAVDGAEEILLSNFSITCIFRFIVRYKII